MSIRHTSAALALAATCILTVGTAAGASPRREEAGSVAEVYCHGLRATISAIAGGEILGTPADDVIVGSSFDDTIYGRGGNDTICGRDGNDVIRGGADDDVLAGENGDDVIKGDGGRDTLFGFAGEDQIDTCELTSGLY